MWIRNPAHNNALGIVTANVGPGPNQRIDIEIIDLRGQKNVSLSKWNINAETRLAITTRLVLQDKATRLRPRCRYWRPSKHLIDIGCPLANSRETRDESPNTATPFVLAATVRRIDGQLGRRLRGGDSVDKAADAVEGGGEHHDVGRERQNDTAEQESRAEGNLKLLEDPYFQVSALESILSWLQDETARVEDELMKPPSVVALLTRFVGAKANLLENLDPSLKIARLSSSVTIAVARTRLTTFYYNITVYRRESNPLYSTHVVSALPLPKLKQPFRPNARSRTRSTTFYYNITVYRRESNPLYSTHVVSALPLPKLKQPFRPNARSPNPTSSVTTTINLVFPVAPGKLFPHGFGYLELVSRPDYDNPADDAGILGLTFNSKSLVESGRWSRGDSGGGRTRSLNEPAQVSSSATPSSATPSSATPSSATPSTSVSSSSASRAVSFPIPRQRAAVRSSEDLQELTAVRQSARSRRPQRFRALTRRLRGLSSGNMNMTNMQAHIDGLVENSKVPIEAAKQHAAAILQQVRALNEDTTQRRIVSKNAAALGAVPHDHLARAFTVIALAGLRRFLPDVFGALRSPYNELHCFLAVSTFQFAVRGFAFGEQVVSSSVSRDGIFLSDIYWKFLTCTLVKDSRKADRDPDALRLEQEEEADKKRREALCLRRLVRANREGFRKPFKRVIAQPAVHSDDEVIADERGPPAARRDGPRTAVREKPGRSESLTLVLRYLDARNAVEWDKNPSGKKPPVRKTDTLLPPSRLSRILPQAMTYAKGENDTEQVIILPLDYFSPDAYNAMDVQDRANYGDDATIALPDAAYCRGKDGIAMWKSLGNRDFMAQFGDTVRTRYNVPTEDEILADRIRRDREANGEEEIIDFQDSDDEAPRADGPQAPPPPPAHEQVPAPMES
ncbi:Kinase-like protein [Mycena kentingensis (nom. inval.)]|nr:Kinase-like protein [Mycena kentingensis (nom. inval.)]